MRALSPALRWRRRRHALDAPLMCAKGSRRCPDLLVIRENALREWCGAETHEEVRSAWSRFGGQAVLHRYGRRHFSLLARHRHGDPEALPLLASRMRLRKGAR